VKNIAVQVRREIYFVSMTDFLPANSSPFVIAWCSHKLVFSS
jgi:hypothetical protein